MGEGERGVGLELPTEDGIPLVVGRDGRGGAEASLDGAHVGVVHVVFECGENHVSVVVYAAGVPGVGHPRAGGDSIRPEMVLRSALQDLPIGAFEQARLRGVLPDLFERLRQGFVAHVLVYQSDATGHE